jgi:hypothetical protein
MTSGWYNLENIFFKPHFPAMHEDFETTKVLIMVDDMPLGGIPDTEKVDIVC